MDPIQTAVSLIEGAQALLQGVQALAKAARDLQEAPSKIQQLENMICDLGKLHGSVKKNYGNRLHNPELQSQLESFDRLLQNMDMQTKRARKLMNRKRKGVKMYLTVVVSAMAGGDELAELLKSMNLQLQEWIGVNTMRATITKSFAKTAEKLPTYLRVLQPQSGYRPLLTKEAEIRRLLDSQMISDHEEQQNGIRRRVILIHGLSGMGKSCLARHVAARPPARYVDGAVDIVLGQGCSRISSRDEYPNRLAAKFCRLLRMLGRQRKELEGLNLEDACQLLQETLAGRSILFVLDDVWESDIIARFTQLYDNGCSYLATTRIQSVFETTDAEKVEITKEDVVELSKAILMQHSQLTEEELPEVADTLIQRCGHHPLTLAVIGKALRKETRIEQWEKAIDDLSTYASQAPVPVHYLNDKEAESAATVFGSFDYSLNAMAPLPKDLFISLAALCWTNGPIPEPCLEAIWSALNQKSTFRLVSTRLIEASLLERAGQSSEIFVFYRVHDMVALYLQSKIEEALALLLRHSKQDLRAAIIPWLYQFGCNRCRTAAEDALVEIFWQNDELLPETVLWNIVDVLSTSSTMSDLEAASKRFSRIIGPELARLFLLDNPQLHAAAARCIANCFSSKDYERHTQPLVQQARAPEKLASLLRNHDDALVQRDAAAVLARLAEFRQDASDLILKEIPLKELLDLLDPNIEETHDSVMDSLTALARAGEELAVREIFQAGAGQKLEEMLISGSETAQQRAFVAIKCFIEAGGSSIVQSFLLSHEILERLPWQLKLSLERLTTRSLERNQSFKRTSIKRHVLVEHIALLRGGSESAQLAALQDLQAAIEKAGDHPQVLDTILSVNLIETLASKLDDHHGKAKSSNRIKSEVCFALAKLSSAGIRCIKAMIKNKVVENLVQIMVFSSWRDMQVAAYSALHSLILTGQRTVIDQILRASLVDKIMLLLESGLEIGLHCVYDLVEIGGKQCIERLLSLRVLEKLAAGKSRDTVVEFAKLVRKCSGLSAQEHRVLNQQVLRHARAALKDNPKQLTKLNTLLKSFTERGEGSGSGSGSSGARRRTSI